MKPNKDNLSSLSTTESNIDNHIKDLGQEDLWPKTTEQTDKRTQAIRYLGENGTLRAMNALVGEWGRWVAIEYNPSIVDIASQQISTKAIAIRPLIDLLRKRGVFYYLNCNAYKLFAPLLHIQDFGVRLNTL